MDRSYQYIILIGLSFLVAMILTMIPLPHWAVNWRPAWLALVLIYWCMAMPERVGVGISWVAGFVLDVQQGEILGLNALGLTILGYMVLQSHRHMRLLPIIHQTLFIGFYLLLYQSLMFLIRGMLGVPPRDWGYWLPIPTSLLVWPGLFIILRYLRRLYATV